MGEFVRQVNKRATAALREIFGQEPLPEENPLLELMGSFWGTDSGRFSRRRAYRSAASNGWTGTTWP